MKPDQHVEEIERTRADIDRILRLLEARLSPRELFDQALRWSGGPRVLSRSIGSTIRDNPVPAALMGIGLLWLMAAGAANRKSPDDITREQINRRMQEVDLRLNV